MANYKILESVQHNRIESVHSYEDISNHHPSKNFNEGNRHYDYVDGKKEEILSVRGQVQHSQEGYVFVSKDLVLVDSQNNSGSVVVPAPVSGYIKIEQSLGRIKIFDKPDGEMIVQAQHMDLRNFKLKNGDYIEYGQPMGVQAGKGPQGLHQYPTHTHIDFNTNHLDKFKQYIKDIDSGVITTDKYPAQNQPNPFANPDNFGALEIPSLSPVAQTIKQQCHSHVHGFCERNNQPWTEGMDNTYMALTVVAREAKMSGIDALGVSQGTIYIAQTDRKGIYREAEINSREAANIPLAQSEQRLAIVDQQMLAQEQQQAIDNLAQTQHKVHSGPRMG